MRLADEGWPTLGVSSRLAGIGAAWYASALVKGDEIMTCGKEPAVRASISIRSRVNYAASELMKRRRPARPGRVRTNRHGAS